MIWNGVMPAITTCFDSNYAVDHKFIADHCRWLLDNGCTGLVPLGSLGEGATLSFDEKLDVIKTCVKAARGKAHVGAVIKATPLACMLYNNPVAYGTDFLPEHIQELAQEHGNLEAVKESSTDAR